MDHSFYYNNKKLSLYRRLEMKILADQHFSGLVVDLGGAEISGYHKLMTDAERIIRVNINPEYGCDVVADIEKRIPFDSNSVNHVVCLNVLEHIYHYDNVLREANRILLPGGAFYLATPFLFQIHGSPDDYFRYTDTALHRLLKEAGFRTIESIPMGFGIFSSIYQLLYGLFPDIVRGLVETVVIFLDNIVSSKSRSSSVKNYPMGYFTVAIK